MTGVCKGLQQENSSKLNKLLQAQTINRINYLDNYKLLSPSSSSITLSATNSHESVIRRGPATAANVRKKEHTQSNSDLKDAQLN